MKSVINNIKGKFRNIANMGLTPFSGGFKKRVVILGFFLGVVLGAGLGAGVGAASEWLWKIEDTTVSEKKFRIDHDTYFTMVAWQMNMTPDQLIKTLNSSSEVPQIEFLRNQLAEEVFAEQYERILVLNLEADKNKYDEIELTTARLDFFRKYYRAQMYLQDLLNRQTVTVSDEEVEEAWAREKGRNEQLSSIPIEQGLKYMRQQLELQKVAQVQEKVMDGLIKEYSIKRNPEFDNLLKGEAATPPDSE